MVKFFNGTSAEAFFSIKESGFNALKKGNWSCSDTTKVYLASYDYNNYTPEERKEYGDEICDSLSDAFRLSLENAKIAAAIM